MKTRVIRHKMTDRGIRLASKVRFRSERGVETGTVVIIESGLYGILVKGVDGLFWRDINALKVSKDSSSPRSRCQLRRATF